MKNEKTSGAGSKSKTGKTSSNQVSGNSKGSTATGSRTETGATGKVRAHAGKGLSDEGTTASYEDEQRND